MLATDRGQRIGASAARENTREVRFRLSVAREDDLHHRIRLARWYSDGHPREGTEAQVKREVEYEVRQVTFHPKISRSESLRALTEAADTGRWELARTVVGMGGQKTVWLCRRVMTVVRTA